MAATPWVPFPSRAVATDPSVPKARGGGEGRGRGEGRGGGERGRERERERGAELEHVRLVLPA